MTPITLEPNEVLFTDSEDMVSCFDLFKMPDCWSGYFTFEKPVARSAFGGDPNEVSHVYMRAVPTGWLGAVDVMQSMARRLVFDRSSVPPEAELRKYKEPREPDIAVVCMDGFGRVERVKLFDSSSNGDGPKTSKEISRFVVYCRKPGLPLNVSKSLTRGLRANTFGEIDGVFGKVSHSREKSFKSMCKLLLC